MPNYKNSLNQIPAVPSEIQANPSSAGFGVYKMMLKQWVDSEILNLPKNPSVASQSNTGQTQTPEINTFCRDDLLKIIRTYIVLQAIPIDGAAQDLQRGLPGDQLCRPPGARPSQAR